MVKYLDNNNSGFNQWRASNPAPRRRSFLSSFLWWTLIFVAAWWMVGVFMGPKKQGADATPDADVVAVENVTPFTVANPDISFTVRGLRISDIELLHFDANPNATSDGADGAAGAGRVTLLPSDGDAFVEIGLMSQNTIVPTATTPWKITDNTMSWRNASGVEFTRDITSSEYVITVTDTVTNRGAMPIMLAPYAHIVRAGTNAESGGVYTGMIAYANNDVEHESWRALSKKAFAYTTTNGFIGFADQYWETVASIDRPDQTMRAKQSGEMYHADTAAGAVTVAPGATTQIVSHIFAGPRDQSILNAASASIHGLDRTVDYGWFWFLARPMLWVLNMIYDIVMNYGIAIIVMTILLRLLMWPLTRKSYVSMIAMQKMQPEMARIQKLYANDKARLQIEMMKLYQSHKTSPMSGCLPMLLQIPIFFALYKALLISVPMRGAHFLWIRDLAAMDPYFILPILMGATMWLQSRLQSPAKQSANANDAAAQTQKMMRWMPVLFTVLFAWMPAGLVLYWTVSNLFGIGQMYVIKYRGKRK